VLHLLASGRVHDSADALEVLIAEAGNLPAHHACRVAERSIEIARSTQSVRPHMHSSGHCISFFS
jgi:hypothetical protein